MNSDSDCHSHGTVQALLQSITVTGTFTVTITVTVTLTGTVTVKVTVTITVTATHSHSHSFSPQYTRQFPLSSEAVPHNSHSLPVRVRGREGVWHGVWWGVGFIKLEGR